jgi:hypothetical protein
MTYKITVICACVPCTDLCPTSAKDQKHGNLTSLFQHSSSQSIRPIAPTPFQPPTCRMVGRRIVNQATCSPQNARYHLLEAELADHAMHLISAMVASLCVGVYERGPVVRPLNPGQRSGTQTFTGRPAQCTTLTMLIGCIPVRLHT